MKYYKKIVGSKVYLAPVNFDDAETYTEWLNDLEVAINLNIAPQVITLEKEKEALEKISKEQYAFSIVDLKTDELIGICGLMDVNLVYRTAELGIFIGNKKYWNRGLGTEAINLLLDYAFNLLNLNNILLKVHSFNERAFNCYRKCGFKEIGRRRQSYIIGDKKYDDIYMDILANEFKGKITDFIN